MAAILKPFVLLWLFGVCLRLTVLAVPPVIPMIHASLELSQAQVGALASLPVLLFSFAAVPGAMLITRYGAFAVLMAGIFLTALASALRGASTDAFTLFATTFAMGAGIAVMQPSLPSVVRDWVPKRVALGTAVYSNGLLVGEALASSLTLPFLLPAVGGNWRLSLVAWSVPVLVIGVMGVLYRFWAAPPSSHARPTVGWPDWKSPLTWRLGFIAGGTSSLYFATNAFLPDYLHHLGRADLLAAALAANNWMQLPASFLLLAFPGRLMMRRWPLVLSGALLCVAMVGMLLSRDVGVVAWAGVIGFFSAMVFTLALALLPALAPAPDVPRVSAAVFAIGYLCAIVTPVLGGFLWDVTGIAWMAFLPAGLFGVVIMAASLGLRTEPA